MGKPVESIGFIPRLGRGLGRERRTAAVAELVAGVALAIGIVVVATVVTAGIAHAGNAAVANAAGVGDSENGPFAIALVLGLMFIGMGGLTMLSLPDAKPHRPRR